MSIKSTPEDFNIAVPDGTFYAPGHEPILMPPMEVKNYPGEWETQEPGGHTKRAPGTVPKNSELVRQLVALMKDTKNG